MIRAWKYEDVAAVAELEKECFRDPWSYQMLAETFMNGRFESVLCEENGEVAGYGGAIFGVEAADIANIAVRESYRGKGIGKKLVNALVKKLYARGVRRIFLEVRVSNAAAMALYLRCGFVGVAVRPRYYGDGEDALVMKKEKQA